MVFLANSLGRKYGKYEYEHGTHVHLVFNVNLLSSLDPKLTKVNDDRSLRLLTQTKDLVIVFEKPESQRDKTKSVFVLKRADLTSVHSWELGDKRGSAH